METGQQLINDFSDADTAPLQHQLDELQRRWNALQGGECDRLLGLLFDWVECREKEMAEWQPVALKEELISPQLTDLQRFQSDLQSYGDEVKMANETCERLLAELTESESESEFSRLKQQVDDLNERWDQLHAGAGDRQTALDEGMDRAKKFEVARLKLVPWLEDAEVRVAQIVGAEVAPEELKEQQAKIQV